MIRITIKGILKFLEANEIKVEILYNTDDICVILVNKKDVFVSNGDTVAYMNAVIRKQSIKQLLFHSCLRQIQDHINYKDLIQTFSTNETKTTNRS